MHGRGGEVGEAARVVEVEMGRHDVAHVGDAEAESGHLPQRRLGDLEPGPGRGPEQKAEPGRIGDVVGAEPAVDQDEPVLALDQEAMAAHRAADEAAPHRAHRPAIEMMDFHARAV